MISNIACRSKCFCPHRFWQAGFDHHRPCHVRYRPVHPFSFSILLMRIYSASFKNNARLFHERTHSARVELFSLIRTDSLDAPSRLCFDHSFEFGKSLIELVFCGIEIYSRHARKIIDKNQAVYGSSRYRIYLTRLAAW